MYDDGISKANIQMTEEQKKAYGEFIEYLVILYRKYGCSFCENNDKDSGF